MRSPVVDQIFGANKAPLGAVLQTDFEDLAAEVEGARTRANALPQKVKSDDDQAAIGAFVVDMRDLAKRIEGIRVEEGKPLLEAQRGLNAHFKGLVEELTGVVNPLQTASDDYARRKAAEERARREREAADARAKAEAERLKSEQARSAETAAKAAARAAEAEARADRHEQAANASTADTVRARHGGVTSSAKTVWAFEITDYPALTATLGPLGNFIDQASVEKAVRSMVRIQKGSTSLPGVRVFEETKSTFRR